MNAQLSQPAAARPQKLELLRLFLIAAVLPAAIAGVNYALWERIAHRQGTSLEVCLHFGWYVFQVGLVGFSIGRGIAYAWLRCLVLGWNFLLINLLAALLAAYPGLDRRPEQSMPPGALMAGQMGLCVVWALLGDTRWMLRWPATILAAAGLFSLWLSLGNSGGQRLWTELLVLQVVTLSVLCGVLRLSGFRLLNLGGDETTPVSADVGQRGPLQFGIRHVLMWTTALAILLGFAKALELLNWRTVQELVSLGVWKFIVATASAIVIIVALWSVLGRGHWAVRYPVALLITLLIGSGLGLWSRTNAAAMTATPVAGLWSASVRDLLRWYEVGWWWLGWLFLSGGLLAATLIILRVLGYRLVRVRGKAK